MPSELQLADDYAAALDSIASRATENTTRALAKSMVRTLRQLRRYYGDFINPKLEASKSADGVTRRPGSYTMLMRETVTNLAQKRGMLRPGVNGRKEARQLADEDARNEAKLNPPVPDPNDLAGDGLDAQGLPLN